MAVLEDDGGDFGLLGLSRVRVFGFADLRTCCGFTRPMYGFLGANEGGVRPVSLGMLGGAFPAQ